MNHDLAALLAGLFVLVTLLFLRRAIQEDTDAYEQAYRREMNIKPTMSDEQLRDLIE